MLAACLGFDNQVGPVEVLASVRACQPSSTYSRARTALAPAPLHAAHDKRRQPTQSRPHPSSNAARQPDTMYPHTIRIKPLPLVAIESRPTHTCIPHHAQARKQAEKALKQLSSHAEYVPELCKRMEAPDAQGRQLAAVLLRRAIGKLLPKLPAEVRGEGPEVWGLELSDLPHSTSIS